jgi:hypothetical protein
MIGGLTLILVALVASAFFLVFGTWCRRNNRGDLLFISLVVYFGLVICWLGFE